MYSACIIIIFASCIQNVVLNMVMVKVFLIILLRYFFYSHRTISVGRLLLPRTSVSAGPSPKCASWLCMCSMV